MKRIAVFASGNGTDFQSIIDGVNDGYIDGKIVLFLGNRKKAYSFSRAAENNIPSVYINKVNYTCEDDMDKALLAKLEEYDVDLLVLAGCLIQLGARTISRFKNRIINIHPALIPSFCGKGLYGLRVHEAAIEYGVKLSGCTIHFAEPDMDTGPIIMQRAVAVLDDDDAETLQARILEVEHEMLRETLHLFCEDRIEVKGRKVRIKED